MSPEPVGASSSVERRQDRRPPLALRGRGLAERGAEPAADGLMECGEGIVGARRLGHRAEHTARRHAQW